MIGKLGRQHVKDGFLFGGGKGACVLLIQPQHLLPPGHDAGFHRGGASGKGNQRGTDAFGVDERTHLRGRTVLAHGSGERRHASESRDVARHVARAAEKVTLAFDAHHGHRSFRGNAIGVTHQVGVEHDVPDHENTLARQPFHGLGRQNRRGHRFHLARQRLSVDTGDSPRRPSNSASWASDS